MIRPGTRPNGPRPQSHDRRLATTVGANLIVRIAGAASSMAFLVVVANKTNDAAVGQFTLLSTVVLIGTILGRFGSENTITALVPSRSPRGGIADWRGALGNAQRMVAVASLAVIVAILLGASPLASLLSDDPSFVDALRASSLAIVPMAWAGLCGGALRAGGRTITGSVIDGTAGPSLALAALILLPAPTVVEVALVWAGGWAVAAAVGAVVVRSVRSASLTADESSGPVVPTRTIISAGHPLVVIGLLNLALSSSDLFVLGWLEDDATVGHYGVSIRIVGASTLVLTALNGVLQPRIADAHRNGTLASLGPQLIRITLLLGALGLAIFAAVALLRMQILDVFGPDFKAAATPLVILAAGQAMVLATGPAGAVLLMSDRQHIQRQATVAGVAANVVGDLLLVPTWGATGAAIATTVALSAKNLYAAGRAWEALRV